MCLALLSALCSRRLLARTLSTFICSVLIVIRPFSHLGGQWAFLALTIKELHFSAQDTLAQQLEATVLHVWGGLCGIGISALAKYLTSLVSDPVNQRALPAIFLVIISFFAGGLKSRLPRLTGAARIVMFISVWLLMQDVGQTQIILPEAGNFLWVTLTASVTALIASMILLRWSSVTVARVATAALTRVHDCLSNSLDSIFTEGPGRVTLDRSLLNDLLKLTINLNTAYHQTAFELRLGHVGVKPLKPLVFVVEQLRRDLSWGMSFPRVVRETQSSSEVDILQSFRDPALELGGALLESLEAVKRVIGLCYDHALKPVTLDQEKIQLHNCNERLNVAIVAARNKLKDICDELGIQRTATLDGHFGLSQEVYDLCLFMISLLQMAHSMRHTITIVQDLVASYENSPIRLYYPRFTAAWLGVAPASIIHEEGEQVTEQSDNPAYTDPNDTLENLVSQTSDDGDADSDSLREKGKGKRQVIAARPLSYAWWAAVLQVAWNMRTTLRYRLMLSRFLRSLLHSSHVKHAFKNAMGVALLSIPAFLPNGSPGRRWFDEWHGQWMVISFIWVHEINVGQTWRVGYLRFWGTVGGAIYGFVATVIAHRNPYLIVFFLTLAELPLSYLVINTTVPSLGVVGSITLPPLILLKYIVPNVETSDIMLAVQRCITIVAGIVAAQAINSIFPRHCRVLFLDGTSRTLQLMSELYMVLSRDLFNSGHLASPQEKRKTIKLELSIRNSLHRLSLLMATMNDELSLVPKPMRRYRRLLGILQNLLDVLSGIRKARENIPRRETVNAVIAQRRELVSCVCISFFACEQVYRGRQPLPQYLPSSRQAVRTLERHIEEHIKETRDNESIEALGLSLIYAFAEIDLLRDLAERLEDLLDVTKQLFGSHSWFMLDESGDMTIRMATHDRVGSD
ncbi:hypothetical protein EV121DRAFT_279390 [Schizophyllum commune]